jgi:hypothetical protein
MNPKTSPFCFNLHPYFGVPWNPLGPVTAAGPATVQAVAVAAASVAARPPPPPGSSPRAEKRSVPKTPLELLHCYIVIVIYIYIYI